MNEVDALELVQAAIWTIIVAAGPAVGLAMLLGIVIALLQAVTQIQEVTLTFVPKILALKNNKNCPTAIINPPSKIQFLFPKKRSDIKPPNIGVK